jgi:hypothetical protein
MLLLTRKLHSDKRLLLVGTPGNQSHFVSSRAGVDFEQKSIIIRANGAACY